MKEMSVLRKIFLNAGIKRIDRRAGSLVAVVAVVLLAAAASSGGAPAIHLPQARHEFAPVPEGAMVSHDFIIRNPGGADLEILKVDTG